MNIRIALVGNPNSGKTTLFNALTGSNQYVGNWPGVTVEKKEGKLKKNGDIILTDLPGIYSLSPYTTEEIVARDYLINEKPEAIINIIDGTNLERNLYLTTQLIELGIPMVIAINMMDVVRKKGDIIDIRQMSKLLGCPVYEVSALKGIGLEEVANGAVEATKSKPAPPKHIYSGVVEHALAHIEEALLHDMSETKQRWYAIKIFESDQRVLEENDFDKEKLEHIKSDIESAERELDDDAEALIINDRYNYITSIIKSFYKKKKENELTTSDKIDRIVTSRVFGLPIFVGVMALVYLLAMKWVGGPATDWVNDVLFGEYVPNVLSNLLEGRIADWLYALISDGIVAGVGAVLGFVPQMIVLFLCLSFLEGCGYMARVAFVMDKIFRSFGLSGKSFIPMLIGTGCSVPGIMASRTVENESDRRMTIMTTSFIPCSAKLPIIGLIAGACFGGSGLIATSAYFIGVFSIIVSGIMLKKTKPFASKPAPFVMELPAYHMPTATSVLRSTWERAWSFIKKAGTVIALAAIIIWFLQAFTINGGLRMTDDMNESILALIGNAFCWLFTPLGFGGWKPAVAVVTGLAAKENVVSTFGVLYHFAGDISENGSEIWLNLKQNLNELSGGHASLAAYSFLIFNLLCAPCIAAMGAIRREMNNSKWTAFAISYQCIFAYVVSLIIFQVGKAIAGDVSFIGLAAAIACVIGLIYMLTRKSKYEVK